MLFFLIKKQIKWENKIKVKIEGKMDKVLKWKTRKMRDQNKIELVRDQVTKKKDYKIYGL